MTRCRAVRWGRCTAAIVAVTTLTAGSPSVATAVVAERPAGSTGQAAHLHPDPGSRTAVDRVARAQSSTRGVGGYLLDWGDPEATDLAKLDYIVMQPWEYGRIPSIRTANPDVVVLMYKNAAAVRRDVHPPTQLSSTGLTYEEARTGGWLLSDHDGEPIRWADWPDLYPVDVAQPGYQQRWLANTLRDLRRDPWDGVLLDDVLSRLSHSTHRDATSPVLPDDDAMLAATSSFLAAVGPALATAGYQSLANATDVTDRTWRNVLTGWRGSVTGFAHEFFVKWGTTRGTRFGAGDDWTWKNRLAAWTARREIPLLAVTYSDRDDRAAQLYHRATWLLTWNGHTGASVFSPSGQWTDHVTRPSTLAVARPKAPPTQRDGLHRRRYTGGLVLVNPTDAPRTVRLRRAYYTPGGAHVRSIRVPARSGRILSTRPAR